MFIEVISFLNSNLIFVKLMLLLYLLSVSVVFSGSFIFISIIVFPLETLPKLLKTILASASRGGVGGNTESKLILPSSSIKLPL